MKQTHGEYCGLQCDNIAYNQTSRLQYYCVAFARIPLLKYDRTANQIRRCAACMKEGE